MAEFTRVMTRSDLSPGQCNVVEAAGKTLAVYDVDGEIHAIDNACPHADGPLGEGTIDGGVVVCPWHMWRFDIKTGEACDIPGMSVARYETKVEGDDVFVAI